MAEQTAKKIRKALQGSVSAKKALKLALLAHRSKDEGAFVKAAEQYGLGKVAAAKAYCAAAPAAAKKKKAAAKKAAPKKAPAPKEGE